VSPGPADDAALAFGAAVVFGALDFLQLLVSKHPAATTANQSGLELVISALRWRPGFNRGRR
jgi:hypothetical protein